SVEGGPRDKVPPKILKMEPKDLTTNFKAKQIVIQFDEFFKLQDQYKEFNISPDVEKQPQLKVKKRSLEITFQDTLEKNTTYTMNFGKMIADINESNVLKNLTYVFSTGPKLDSLTLSGQVIDAVTGLPVLDAVAYIVPIARDTILGKHKPSIYTTTDSSGRFALKNLREGSYKAYALKEEGGDKIYQQSTDQIGFIKEPIDLKASVSDLTVSIFKEDPTVFHINDRKLNPDGSIQINWNKKLKKPNIVITGPSNLDVSKQVKFSKNNDSVRVWLSDLSFDSTKISITDSNKVLQTIKLTRGKKDTYQRPLIPESNLEGDLLNPNQPLKFTFPSPVTSIDPAKIELLEDSVKITNFQVVKDSSDFLSYQIRYRWVPKRSYEIKFTAGAVTGQFNAKNKEFRKVFALANAGDYGTLHLTITAPEPNKSYVLQVTNEAKNVVNELVLTKDTSVTFTNYKAGRYFARIVYDSNKNGIWDTGLVTKGLQPEHMYNEPKELSIRANWDRKETIAIPKESEIPKVVPVPVVKPATESDKPDTGTVRPGMGNSRPGSGSGRPPTGTRPNT
ncbi:MAG: hypothetical protein JWQ28_2879, partial [Pedobacter sp.]|nr:hypothetical protein [Pedobacter sp.]